jgi:hypothetical protein
VQIPIHNLVAILACGLLGLSEKSKVPKGLGIRLQNEGMRALILP